MYKKSRSNYVKLFTALVVEIITVPLLIVCLVYIFSGVYEAIFFAVMLLILFVPVTLMLKSAINQISSDKNLLKHGVVGFGKIIEISNSGFNVGGHDVFGGKNELKANLVISIPSLNIVKRIETIIGFEPSPYKEGDYVEIKYADDDCVICNVINKETLNRSVELEIDEFIKRYE